jgi:hypothetical protein
MENLDVGGTHNKQKHKKATVSYLVHVPEIQDHVFLKKKTACARQLRGG